MQQQLWVTRSSTLCTTIASGLQHVFEDLDAVSAAFPIMLGRQKQVQGFDGSSAISVLQHWWVTPYVLPRS
jgi:hypothetical protein